MPGLVPGIPFRDARPCQAKRDGRDKPGHDKSSALLEVQNVPTGQNRPTIRIFRSLSGVKSFAVTSVAVGEIGFVLGAQKLTSRSGFWRSTTKRKSLIGPAQFAPVLSR